MRHLPVCVGASRLRGGVPRGHPLPGSIAPAREVTTRAAGGTSLLTCHELTAWNRTASPVVYVINGMEPLRVWA
jgi:hypothetical protein